MGNLPPLSSRRSAETLRTGRDSYERHNRLSADIAGVPAKASGDRSSLDYARSKPVAAGSYTPRQTSYLTRDPGFGSNRRSLENPQRSSLDRQGAVAAQRSSLDRQGALAAQRSSLDRQGAVAAQRASLDRQSVGAASNSRRSLESSSVRKQQQPPQSQQAAGGGYKTLLAEGNLSKLILEGALDSWIWEGRTDAGTLQGLEQAMQRQKDKDEEQRRLQAQKAEQQQARRAAVAPLPPCQSTHARFSLQRYRRSQSVPTRPRGPVHFAEKLRELFEDSDDEEDSGAGAGGKEDVKGDTSAEDGESHTCHRNFVLMRANFFFLCTGDRSPGDRAFLPAAKAARKDSGRDLGGQTYRGHACSPLCRAPARAHGAEPGLAAPAAGQVGEGPQALGIAQVFLRA